MRGALERLGAVGLSVVLIAALPGLGTALAETSGPDIQMRWLVTDPDDPDVGEDVRFTANLTNAGDEATGEFAVVFDVYDHETQEIEQVDKVTVRDLAPDEALRVGSQAWNGSEGRYTVRVLADPGDEVNETDERDNVRTDDLTVGDPLPDLEAHFQVHEPHVSTEDAVSVEYGVSNRGQGDAGSFWTEIRLDGELLDRSRQQGMSPYTGWAASTQLGPIEEPGEHELTFVVDADDDVNETDETDNRLVERVKVFMPPDPAVKALDVEKERLRTDAAEGPANPIAGQEIEATFGENSDATTSYWAELEVEVCPDEASVFLPHTVRCELLRSELVSSEELAQGYTVEETWDTAGKAGDWTVCARLQGDLDPQLDYANDEACQDTFVLVGGTGLGGLAPDWPR